MNGAPIASYDCDRLVDTGRSDNASGCAVPVGISFLEVIGKDYLVFIGQDKWVWCPYRRLREITKLDCTIVLIHFVHSVP